MYQIVELPLIGFTDISPWRSEHFFTSRRQCSSRPLWCSILFWIIL